MTHMFAHMTAAPQNAARRKHVRMGSRRPIPADFATVAPTMARQALAAHYKTHHSVVARWLSDAGIKAGPRQRRTTIPPRPKPRGPRSYAGPKSAFTARLPHDVSLEGQAADVLRKYCAVYRCTETGRADQRGDFWRYGNAVLLGEQLIERARRHGFDPNAWQRLIEAAVGEVAHG